MNSNSIDSPCKANTIKIPNADFFQAIVIDFYFINSEFTKPLAKSIRIHLVDEYFSIVQSLCTNAGL